MSLSQGFSEFHLWLLPCSLGSVKEKRIVSSSPLFSSRGTWALFGYKTKTLVFTAVIRMTWLLGQVDMSRSRGYLWIFTYWFFMQILASSGILSSLL